MKTKIYLFLIGFSFFFTAVAQVPSGFNYQAVARNSSGEPILNTPLPVTITIQSDSLGGTIFWKEIHTSVISDNSGVISLVIGKGLKQSGIASTFKDIDWSVTPKFINTQIYYKDEMKNLGSSRFWSVPYSMTASEIAGSLEKLQVEGKNASLTDALFEVKNTSGQTVFAVYNEGVRVYVDDMAKGAKGGFAVGGFGFDKGLNEQYLFVSQDSIRAYIGPNDTKASKGGFAVSGFSNTKEVTNEQYLRVTSDSTRVYVNDTPGKAAKGGFAVGSFSGAKTEVTNFLDLTEENYFIGHRSGSSNLTGKYNSVLGYEAGVSNTEGSWNTFIGYKAGYANTTGYANIFIGDSAGTSNTSGEANVMIGNWAGYLNSTGKQNVIVGIAGYENTTGNSNVFVGTFAGTKNHDGVGNVFIGDYAGAKTSGGMLNAFMGKNAGANALSGSKNVFIGNNAGKNASGAEESIVLGADAGFSATGVQNVILGTKAGYSNTEGRNNVFIGYSSGYYETGSDKLYISNNDTDSPLIWGDFVEGLVVIGGNISNNPNHRALFVCGPAGGVTAWYNDSDRNLKHDITTIPDALDKIMKLRGVNFKWNDPKPGMENLQMGFIGQEAEAVIPEVVSSSNNHYAMQYAPITALLVEGMKAQEKKIEDQQKEIEELKSLVKSLIEE